MGFPFAPKKQEQAGQVQQKQQAAKPQAAAAQAAARGPPAVGSFSVNVRLKGGISDVIKILRSVSFLEVAQEKDAANALYVESRDINKQPYVFSILNADESRLELVYSIPPGMAPGRRKLDMSRYFINVLTMLEPYYEVDNKIVLQLMESSIKDVIDSVSMDYSKLYTEYDTVKKTVEDLRRKVKRLTDENSSLSTDNYELKNRNDELLLRMKQLEGLPDDALKAKVQEWIIEHNGEINIPEFCRVNNSNEVRVEEVLNGLITEGYIEAVK